MITQVKWFIGNFRQYQIDDKKRPSIDIILSDAYSRTSLEERIEWIQQLFKWTHSDSYFSTDHHHQTPVIKIKFLLVMLDRNPHWKNAVCNIFRQTLNELSAIDLFCEIGLPNQIGFIGEVGEKIMDKVLPVSPITNQLGELLLSLFPNKEDADWIRAIDEETLEKIFELFQYNDDFSINSGFPHLQSDIEDALIYLVSQIVAIGLSPLVRKRIGHSEMKTLPYFFLSTKLNEYLKLTRKDDQSSKLKNASYKELIDLLGETSDSINEVYFYLDQHGVSVHLVYQLERLNQYIKRTLSLLELNHGHHVQKQKIADFTADLISDSLNQKSIGSLISGNVTLLAQKIVEVNSRTGEHYIAQDEAEYWKMFKSALKGGLVTAFTVYIKNFMSTLPVTRFIIGAYHSLNYSSSFLLIQFAGGTLGTKQPANTASSLAHKLEKLEKVEEIEKVTDEIVMVSRTQFISVIGNISAVIPTVLLVNFIYHFFTSSWILSPEQAEYSIHSIDVWGPTVVYAAFTGVLLWLSSVASGWSDNWFAYNKLRFLIENNKKYQLLFGHPGSIKIAKFLENNISGISANISLGILLGLAPEFLAFIGIPLEVRHVTLSAGAIAASIPELGFKVLATSLFWRSFLGLILVGFLNIFVSFSLAFFVAIRAKNIASRKRRLIYRSVLKRFSENPISFFIPPKSSL